jgi:DNA-binding transcriptional LysR family regulator
VLHDWAIAGQGIAWRSMWEVNEDLSTGRLVTILNEFRAPDNAIYAVFPQRKQMPLRVRMFIDYLKKTFSDPNYWNK